MGAGSAHQTIIELQGRDSSLCAGLIRHFQQLLLGFLIETLGGLVVRGGSAITLGGRRLHLGLFRRKSGCQEKRDGNQGPKHLSVPTFQPLGGVLVRRKLLLCSTATLAPTIDLS